MSFAFDTLRAAQRLNAAGFSEEQAASLATTFAEGITENLATKDDIVLVHKEVEVLGKDIKALDTKIDTSIDKLRGDMTVNRHSTVTHYQRPTVTQLQEGGTGGEVSEILFFSAKSKRRPSLIYSMQIIPVCLSIVARRKEVSATRRGGLNWTPISLLVGHPCKLFHRHDNQIGWHRGRWDHCPESD